MFKKFLKVAIVVATLAIVVLPALADDGLVTIYAGAMESYDCNNEERHFVITDISEELLAPLSIILDLKDGTQEVVLLTSFTGKVAHYTTFKNLDIGVQSASAEIYEEWEGQFRYSHGPCGPNAVTVTEFEADNDDDNWQLWLLIVMVVIGLLVLATFFSR